MRSTVLNITLIAIIVMLFSNVALMADGQLSPLTSIDLYGLRTMSENEIRRHISVKIGTREPINTDSIAKRIKSLNGVADVHIIGTTMTSVIGTTRTTERQIFIGIREVSAKPPIATTKYLASQTGDCLLPDNFIKASQAFSEALSESIRLNQSGEDHSQGHSLINYAPGREIQLKFVGYANKHKRILERVLRESKDASHRQVAAQIIAYLDNKAEAVRILARAARDTDAHVRNNAVRALMVIADYAKTHPEKNIVIPVDPFLPFLESLTWTDRNKGAALVRQLIDNPDDNMMDTLRRDYLPCIVEMARWRSPGHAGFSLHILARLAEVPNEEIKTRSAAAYENFDQRLAWIEELLQSITDMTKIHR